MPKRITVPIRKLDFHDLDASRKQLVEEIAKSYPIMLRTTIALLHLVDWDETVARQCLASGLSAGAIELAFELLEQQPLDVVH